MGTWYIRHLEELDQPRSEVNVFRKGMWISSRVDHLKPSNLDDTKPADVVLCLEDEGEPLTKLAREAEGPQHLGLEMKRLDGPQRAELRGLLQTAHEWLRNVVGRQSPGQSFTPPEFAEMAWNGQTGFRAVQLIRASKSVPTDADDAKDEGAALVDGADEDGALGGGGTDSDSDTDSDTEESAEGDRRSPQPAPGTLVHYRAATKRLSNNSLQAHVKFNGSNRKLKYVGIRVKELSPSDASCQLPLGDTYLTLVKVSEADQHTQQDHVPDENGGEVRIELRSDVPTVTFIVETASTIPNADYVEIEIVRRASLSEGAKA